MDIIKGEITRMIKNNVFEVRIELLDARNSLTYAGKEKIFLNARNMELIKEMVIYGQIRGVVCTDVLCSVKKRKKNGHLDIDRLMVIRTLEFDKLISECLTR